MKLVINGCYGGFELDKRITKALGAKWYDDVPRTNKTLIRLIETCGSKAACHSEHTKLEVVELPDETTDYAIREYDGLETVIYVVDGKLHYA